jgi:ribosomal protein L6P/L9E
MVKQFIIQLPNMNYKTTHDIEIVSQSGDKITIKGLSYSTIMQIANNNPELQSINITKQYEKKISKY